MFDRTQSVIVNSLVSDPGQVTCGVPQGSVLGPLLFTLYTTPLSYQLQTSDLSYHFYADDTQLYVSFSANHNDGLLDFMHSVVKTKQIDKRGQRAPR